MYRILGTTLFALVLLLSQHGTASAQQAVIWNAGGGFVMMDESSSTTTATPAPSDGGDEGLLRSVGINASGPSLLSYFRIRSKSEAKPDRVAGLIENLGDKSLVVAQKACGELAAIGEPAVPALRQAVKDPDRQQMARLAQRCLHALEQNPGQLSAAAARLLAQYRPAGAAEALLEFAPMAEDEGVIEEIRLALAALAYTSGKFDPALLKSVSDDSPVRRALAIDTLCHNGITPSLLQQVPLPQLLHDPSPTVRLRTSLALAGGRDAKAVSTLITLLTELPLDQARQAEEYLTELAGDLAPKTTLGADAASRQKCRDAWATWWQATEDDNRLLEELRKRTVTDALRQKCEDLIRQLGDSDFSVREKAQAEVKAMGSLIVPLLRHAAKDPDLEIRNRARDCLSAMERDKNLPLSPMTPRLIALRKPAGAAEALLAFIPFADEEATLPEVQLALDTVSFRNGKPDPTVVRALSDPQATRRAAAAEALCLGGDRTHLETIRKMLTDSEPAVRLKVALALAGTGQRDAVPALINLLGELPLAEAEPAEEYLQRLAGDRPPTSLPSGDDKAARKKRQEAWAAWWKTNGERLRLVERYPPAGTEHYLGHVLLVLANTGEVMELDRDRKVRWQLNGLMNPRDVEVLGNDRILVAEWGSQRVTERNRKGDIIWQKQTQGSFPLAVQRLRNGHTFIACNNKLLEVDRAGNEVYSITRPHDVIMARKMRDGQILLVSTMRQCIRMDTAGKQLKSFQVQFAWQTGVDILPNGHVVIPATWMNKITEYDTEGKTVLDINANQPYAATRLRNGNLLMAPQQWPSELIETDAAGKQVSKLNLPNFPHRIRSRLNEERMLEEKTMRHHLWGFIVCALVPIGTYAAETKTDTDESALKAAGIPTDGPGLAAYFKKRTTSVSNETHIKDLVRQLGDDEFKRREDASRQLMMLGPRARPFLQAALKDSDPEIVRRAQDCLERISKGTSVTALSAAVRVFAQLRTPDAAAVLLNYLPSAEDERVAETIHQVLPSLAEKEGKAEPAFVEALTDKSSLKRAAAGAALAEIHLADAMPKVRKLLDDSDPIVRQRVALALAARGDKDAIPALIRSIEDVPLEQNGLVLDLLERLADGSSPTGMPVADQKLRRKYRQVWEDWWIGHKDKIGSDRLEHASRTLGFTLIVLLDLNMVAYLDRAKEVRWQFNSTNKPLDVQLLPGEQHVMLAEYALNRVSERNLKGEIVWQKPVVGPLVAQRLPNGNTFITTTNQLIEVDKDGKEVFTYSRPDGGEFMRATKLRDGGIACIVRVGIAVTRYVRLQPSGKDFKEVKSWGVQVRTSGGRLDVQPDGHVLIPEMDNNRVVEYDADGKSVWEVTLDQPIAAVRLPNGNTLVTLMRENRAVEVDRAGKEVWQFKAETKVTRAYRR